MTKRGHRQEKHGVLLRVSPCAVREPVTIQPHHFGGVGALRMYAAVKWVLAMVIGVPFTFLHRLRISNIYVINNNQSQRSAAGFMGLMLGMVLAVLAWGCPPGLQAATLSAAKIFHVTITQSPGTLIAGRHVTVAVRYHAPSGATTLHVEIKYQQGAIVIASVQRVVHSRGSFQAAFVVPKSARGQKVGFAAWMGHNWRKSIGPIFTTRFITVISKAQATRWHRRAVRQRKAEIAFRTQYAAAIHRGRLIGIYQNARSGWPTAISAGLARRLRKTGFTVAHLTGSELVNKHILNGRTLAALVLMNATSIPADAANSIDQYAHTRGLLVSLGGPAFEHMLFHIGRHWLTRADVYHKLVQAVLRQPLTLLPNLGRWQEITNDPKAPYSVARLTGTQALPPGVGHGYRFRFYLASWCGFRSPVVKVPPGNTFTVFWARGGSQAHQMAVEWDEHDGTRWIATVQLHRHWTRYVLPESDFPAWKHPLIPGRYFPGDHLHLRNAATINFGAALTSTDEESGRSYTIEVAGIGTASLGKATRRKYAAAIEAPPVIPDIDTISPRFKLFPVTNMASLEVNPRQSIAGAVRLPTPRSVLGIYPRSQATGLDKHMVSRYVPLLNCLDKKGRFTAVAAALVLPSTAAGTDEAATLSIPVTDPKFFASTVTQRWLADVIARVRGGLYLAEGGTKQYACFAGTAMPLGAVVVNHGRVARSVRVVSAVADARGRRVFRHIFTATVAPGGSEKVSTLWTPPAPRGWENVYRVTTTLDSGYGDHQPVAIDRLVGSLRVLGTSQPRHYVTARHGMFYLHGKPWYVYGVNFWPESSIARESWNLFLNWLSPQSYDPQSVERNLEDVKAIGFNTISIAVTSPTVDGWNLLDVLARARELGLKVNLSIAGVDGLPSEAGGPGTFQWSQVRQYIKKFHLAENNTIFAYDIAWEPHWGTHANRARFDPLWHKWIVQHYGSVQKAEAIWHCPVPRQNGRVTNPSDQQFIEGHRGKAAAMIVAYNRFLNGLLNQCYGNARKLIHSVDPHHLVSFRMSMAGDPGRNPYYDYGFYNFEGLKKAVDIFEPEGYGLMSTTPHIVNRAIFTIQYARAINPDLPVIYAEFGHSEWDKSKDSPSIAAYTGRIYAAFYKAILRAGGNGAICWWFPGGYRCGEKSDYGIINPDRSWRPVTYVIHKFAAQMKAPRPLPVPDEWIPIRLDHVRGAVGVYRSVHKKFWKAVDQGQLPGFKIVGQ